MAISKEAAHAYRARPEVKARRAESKRLSRDRAPEREWARHCLQSAVKSGKVVPWPACAMPECAETNVEAHHADYAAPLDVVWLCRSHHAEAHALARAILKVKGHAIPRSDSSIAVWEHRSGITAKKAIVATPLDGGPAIRFESLLDAQRAGFFRGCIDRSIRGIYSHYKGYVWSIA